MPLLRTKAETPATPIAAPLDVLALARLDHHPFLVPLVENRAALHRRLAALAEERTRLDALRRDLDQSASIAMAEQGEQWQPSREFRACKAALEEVDDQERIAQRGLELLEARFQEARDAAKVEIGQRLNQLRKPLVGQMLDGIQALLDVNRELAVVEG